jgi:hypothetical protein
MSLRVPTFPFELFETDLLLEAKNYLRGHHELEMQSRV